MFAWGGTGVLFAAAPRRFVRGPQSIRLLMPASGPSAAMPLHYASPLELLFSPDGTRLYVLCQESDQVRVLDAVTYRTDQDHRRRPHAARILALARRRRVSLSPTPGTTRSPSSTRTLSTSSPPGRLARSLPVLSKIAPANTLFVANRISNDVAVLDAQTGDEEKRLVAGRGASYLTLSPDGRRLYATHVYPNPSSPTGLENRTPPESEITVIDAARR